jgi:hypothetical protein
VIYGKRVFISLAVMEPFSCCGMKYKGDRSGGGVVVVVRSLENPSLKQIFHRIMCFLMYICNNFFYKECLFCVWHKMCFIAGICCSNVQSVLGKFFKEMLLRSCSCIYIHALWSCYL